MRIIFLLALMSLGFPIFSQTNIYKGKKIETKNISSPLNQHFRQYEIYAIPTDEIFTRLQDVEGEANLQLDLGGDFQWELALFPNQILADHYQLLTPKSFQEVPASTALAFQGYEQSVGGEVRLTVNENFLYGYVESSNQRYFIEPLWYFDAAAPHDQYIVYEERQIIPVEGKTCAVDELRKKTPAVQQREETSENAESVVVGLCYDVELAIASDFLMFQDYGNSVTNVENHNIGVLNNVQGNYDDEFADEINFVIVTQFVSTCNTCDPWSSTTNSSDLLDSFRAWGNGGGFGSVTYDLAQLWTDRDLDSNIIGVAFLNAVCNSIRYNVCQDFSSTAWQLRVLVAHEFGHNFNANHDGAGSGFIMAPSVNNTSTWSSTSINSINSFVNSRTCLAECAGNPSTPPTASFTANLQNICEGSSIQFFDQSVGGNLTYNWSFTGGNPSFSTAANPVVNYSAAGFYPVTLTVTNTGGTNTVTQNGFISVGQGGTNVILYDGFENGLGNWTIENPQGNLTWAIGDVAGTSGGTKAVFMDNWNLNGVGQRDGLISPVVDLSGFTTVSLAVDYAYALFSGASTPQDSLIIKLSTDGGATFPNTLFAGADNGSGNFATAAAQGPAFIPGVFEDWCYGGGFGAGCIQLDLSGFIGEGNVVLKFENYNAFGNNLHLDNILLSSNCEVPLPPETDFAASVVSGCAPLVVNYLDLSLNSPTTWFWTFPGGTPTNSFDQFPTVTYSTPGNYSVTLETSNGAGSDVETKTNYIEVNPEAIANFSFAVNGNSVAFTNLSSDNTSNMWDFGDGNFSAETNPVHTYTSDGTYQVILTVSNICGTTNFIQIIDIFSSPVADFSANTQTGCAPLSVQFTNQSSANATDFQWTFAGGNPATSTEENPTVIYENAGIFSVSLTVTNSVGNNTFTQTDFITVNTTPSVDFSSVLNGQTATFTNLTSNADTYNWDFGDGATSADFSPTHTYAADGEYTVTLAATNVCGIVTTTQTVNVSTQPTANFFTNITSGCAPLTVEFSNQSSANATDFQWTFAGGNPATSTAENPTVVYENAGIFSVSLTVTNSAGNNTFTQTDFITVNTTPSVNFSSVVNESTATFTNLTSNADTYNWDFGDGATSADFSPTHTYAADGEYTVTLAATNACGTVMTTQTINIITEPTANFFTNITSGCAPLTVEFSNQSSANATDFQWTFSGGNPATSTEENPTVVYENAGIFSVSLTVTNSAGNNTFTQTDFITVNTTPSIDFSSVVDEQTVTFTNLTSNADTYNWDFGDGATSTDFSPTHTYAADGEYTVTLAATNACGTVMTTQVIDVSTRPIADFSANVRNGCAPLTVQFENQSSANVTGFQWTFDGGNPATSTEENPTVVYENAGSYTVVLTVSNAEGSTTITQFEFITVDDLPTAVFTQDINGLAVDFFNSSSNADTYAWDFGDGNTSTDFSPNYTYDDDGEYVVTLTTTNICGTATTTRTLVLVTPPTAIFTADVTSGCADLEVAFIDQSSDNVTEWAWTFVGGNPSTSTAQNPTVVYENAGTYSVSLTTTNAAGESQMERQEFIVVTDVPIVDFATDVNTYSVTFANNSINANSFLWNFGDGTTSAEMNPTHTYSNDGTYQVTLEATNDCGTASSMTTVTIANTPSANLTSNLTIGCTPQVIQFTDLSSENTTVWEWNFPGGMPNTSTVPNPTVTYEIAGIYSVTLVARNNVGSDTLTFTDYVEIGTAPTPEFSFDVNGPLVDFNNQTNNATSYTWDFGDGNTSSENNPSHQYALNGNYEVIMNATNACGTTTISKVVTITSSVIAAFTTGDIMGCQPLSVQFDNQSINATSYRWSFAGGSPSSSTAENPIVTYMNAGVYTVMLEAINATGSTTLVQSGYIIVESLPLVSFNTDVNDLTVDFTNITSLGESYLWDFGDGATSTEVNPQHTYGAIGIYTVTLSATNDCGTIMFEQDLEIGITVTTEFSASTTSTCAGSEIQFSDQSSENVTAWSWTFPGGNPATSTAQNPTVQYDNPGVYAVTLEASNTFSSSSIMQTNYITILGEPTADFSTTISGADVGFMNVSLSGVSYFWNFGDGTTSTEENPQHTYANDGNYIVTLEVTNDCGMSTTENSISIVTSVTAGFSANTNEGCTDLIVQFSNASSENVTAWNWTFEGGSPSTSTEQNPTVSYAEAGSYAVTLEVSNSQFSDIQTETQFITINTVPEVSFTSSSMGLTRSYNNTSTNATSYFWDFGDNDTSTEESPTHTYATEGEYVVTLVAINDCGSATSQETLNVVLPPMANFVIENSLNCAPANIQFTDQSSENVAAWNWTFEGGSPSTATVQNPLITFNDAGTYLVTLRVTNAAGIDSFSMEITLEGAPTANFSSSVNVLTTTFNNLSNNALTYLWDFGDGESSTAENPIHEYAAGGNYTVILTATNDCETTTFTQSVEVIGLLSEVGFSSSSVEGCAPFSVSYSDTSTGSPTVWAWEFPGGMPATSSEQNPNVIYNAAGIYDVSLSVTNAAGNSSFTQTQYIIIEDLPTADFTASVGTNGTVAFTNTSQLADIFAWDFGDGNMSIEEAPIYEYATSGVYPVELIVGNVCGTDTFSLEINVVVTGIGEVDFLEKFELYPNPNAGQFTLEMVGEPTSSLEISLVNILGQVILNEQADFRSGELTKHFYLENLPAATYILQVQSGEASVYRKIVKQ